MEKEKSRKSGQFIDVHFSKMDPEIKKEYDRKIINLLEIFISICEKNNIRWFLGYGACIGAVRHKGMIPWDEDIDIIVPRPDFDRFVELCKNIKDVDCDFCIRDDSSNFYEHFIRIADKNSTFCISTDYNHVSGIYIEIAPLDGAGNGNVKWNYKRFRLWEILCHFTRFVYTKEQKKKLFSKGKIINWLLIQFTSIFRKQLRPFATRQLEKTLRKYSYEKSDYVVYYTPVSSWKRNTFKKELLEETIWVPFEDTKARIPQNYHEYLTQIYGDYMTPPPINRRDDGHVFKFVDMNRRYTVEEVKELLKNK